MSNPQSVGPDAVQDPDAIQEDIEVTRGNIREDIEALHDKLSPQRAAQRGVAKVSDSVSQARDKLMGTAEQGTNSAKQGAYSAKQTAADVPDKIRRQARGNPLAMGLGAFALGWIASSLIPASDPEKRAARTVKESPEITEPLAQSAQSVAERAQESVSNAAQTVGREARQGAQDVAEQARGAAQTAGAQV
jgi:hypothetical protein